MVSMKNSIVLALVFVGCTFSVHAQQDRAARKLADKVSAAFSNGLGPLDHPPLFRGPLKVTIQNWIYDVGMHEYEFKTFRSFTAMERWLKKEENQPGFPMRTSGDKVGCSRGVCRLDLVDGQMAHNHVFLTRIWYGRSKGALYVKKIKLLYG
jgi:hypothetical protein